jgi:hypothetical protein
MASFTTHQSTSSFQPTFTYATSSRLTVPKQRTLSSTSGSSSTSPKLQSFVPPPRPLQASHLSVGPDEATIKRREARRLRREERGRKSTLRGDEYDTRLRRVVRWISKQGWREQSAMPAAVVWAVVRSMMERHRLGRELFLSLSISDTMKERLIYRALDITSLPIREAHHSCTVPRPKSDRPLDPAGLVLIGHVQRDW